MNKLSDGNVFLGFYRYAVSMFWKAIKLVQLSSGYWNEELVNIMEVLPRAKKFDVDDTDDDEKHEAM